MSVKQHSGKNIKIYSPEIIIALTGGIGTDLDLIIDCLEREFQNVKYEPLRINLTDLIKKYLKTKKYNADGSKKPKYLRIKEKMDKCTQLRKQYDCNNILSLLAVTEIAIERKKHSNVNRQVFIIKQLKRPEEAKLLKRIYGRNFFLLSVYSSKEKRTDVLTKDIEREMKAHKNNYYENPSDPEALSIELINKDEAESNDSTKKPYGQDLQDTFPLGDYFIRCDLGKNILETSIHRFVEIIFGNPFATPSKDELCMYVAKGLSARSADLSRQVGVVISNSEGEIISIGCNEVPKFGGGFYWEGDKNDARDFRKQYDSNYKIKREIAERVVDKAINKFIKLYKINLSKNQQKTDEKNKKDIVEYLQDDKSEIFDLLEYGRAVHAEEAAICDAAKRGVKLDSCTLYTTTFPCHLCTKHIIAVGIKRVVYIDPYPKSKAKELFDEVVLINPSIVDGKHLIFEPLIGVSPCHFISVYKFSSYERERLDTRSNDKKPKDWCLDSNSFPRLARHRSYLSYYIKEVIFMRKLKVLLNKSIKNDKLEEIEKFEKKAFVLTTSSIEFDELCFIETAMRNSSK